MAQLNYQSNLVGLIVSLEIIDVCDILTHMIYKLIASFDVMMKQ